MLMLTLSSKKNVFKTAVLGPIPGQKGFKSQGKFRDPPPPLVYARCHLSNCRLDPETVHFLGPQGGPFSSIWHYKTSQCPLQTLSPFWGKRKQDPFDMIHAKRSAKIAILGPKIAPFPS